MVRVQLNGFLREDFIIDRPLLMKMGEPVDGALSVDAAPWTVIRNARKLQNSALSESRFFEQHGFVLLSHDSAVTNWYTDPASPAADNDLTRIYLPEVDALIRRRLLPDKPVEIQQSAWVLQRGPGTPNPFYGLGVHQDFGLTADDYQQNLEAYTSSEFARQWRDRYDQDDVAGYMMINFWRTTYMDKPLKHLPLAVCDPNSVNIDDVVPSSLLGFAPTGKPTNQLSLRANPGQQWYYYPDMLGSEVLALKIFQVFKSDREPRLQTCFHSAFSDPAAPEDAERRRSCEHRVSVFCLNT